MAAIIGFHHVSLPATGLEKAGDWYEQVFGFERILIAEEEDRVTMVMLEHPEGMVLCLHREENLRPATLGERDRPAALSFRVAAHADLLLWDERLTELDVEHSGPRPAHLGWALDVLDPSGLRIQLHTRELISGDQT